MFFLFILLLFVGIVTLMTLTCLRGADLQDQSQAALLADESRLVLLASKRAKKSSQLEEEVVHGSRSDGDDGQPLLRLLNVEGPKQHLT